jgi:predicted RNase H-like HicB family nuclease
MSGLQNLFWEVYAQWMRLKSFWKTDWNFDDYPIRVCDQANCEPVKSSRLKLIPYSASVVNWPGLIGAGDTKQEALAVLQKNFENLKANGRKLPRPGTSVPIEFAQSTRLDMHPDLKEDFVRRVLGLPWAFLSDESSLFDFHEDETNEVFVQKIRTAYGVEVSDITSGNVADILERIARIKSS